MDIKKLLKIKKDLQISVITITVLTILYSFFQIITPIICGSFINAIIQQNNILLQFVLLVLTAIIAFTIDFYRKKKLIILARTTEKNIISKIFRAFQSLTPVEADRFPQGEIGMKLIRDSEAIGRLLQIFYPQILNICCCIIFALIVISSKNIFILLMIILFVLFAIYLLKPFKIKFKKNSHAIRKIYDVNIGQIFEFIRISPFLKLMNADNKFIRQPKKNLYNAVKIKLINDHEILLFENINKILLLLGEYSVLGIAGYLAYRQKISIGDVVVYQVLFITILNACTSFFQILPELENINESLHSLNEIFDNHNQENIDLGDKISNLKGDIIFSNVNFYYNSNRFLLKNCNICIKQGSITAIIGTNGCGKTTFLKLVCGYLTPTAGEIFIGKNNIQNIQKKSLRNRISIVSQENLIFTGSLRDNITLKNTKYSDCEILTILKQIRAENLINNLSTGLDYKINIDNRLSGGEQQKIAIARALIRQSDILILDEITSHLDYESRQIMKQLIKVLQGQCTILIVSHDPELLTLCDQQINLENMQNES